MYSVIVLPDEREFEDVHILVSLEQVAFSEPSLSVTMWNSIGWYEGPADTQDVTIDFSSTSAIARHVALLCAGNNHSLTLQEVEIYGISK